MNKLSITFIIFLIFGCQSTDKVTKNKIILPNPADFQHTLDGKSIDLFFLNNDNGIKVAITNYGGRIVSLWVPDKNGKFADVVLGFNSIEEYFEANEKYFGATIGRVANRIANGRFSLNEQEYNLVTNNGPNHLHGGIRGFHNVVWDVVEKSSGHLKLNYRSIHMEEGYPGSLEVYVSFTITNENELKIDYEASTDQPTLVNLTNHAFFNLQGEGKGTINDHVLQINADYFTPVDSTLIPVGDFRNVSDTPFDFRTPTPIGQRLNDESQQLNFGLGYDHNFVLTKNSGSKFIKAAIVFEPISGRTMEVYTSEPGIQFYGGNFMNGKDVGKSGNPYKHRTAFCLETQHFPDTPNQQSFPDIILRPGEKYTSNTTYKFSAR